jgi:hypothetical protein
LNQVNLALFSTDIVKKPISYEEEINSEQPDEMEKCNQQGVKINREKRFFGK